MWTIASSATTTLRKTPYGGMKMLAEDYEAAKQIAWRSLIKKTNSWEKHNTYPPAIVEAVRAIAEQIKDLSPPQGVAPEAG
jgi:hypothetical protein